MADFKYITKLDQHPQGKQRVYFTCHPQDFKPTFEEIKKDILDRQDVAIFYLEPDTRPEEVDDYELQLGEMQLFVVPVTTKLLTTPNRAMDVEVPFAQEHHIPILPLMYESGLDELFNEKFGDLQYLDKFNTDPTAIPFDEKLTNYLESVIVGDELARQVRDAFDAYIFLSYRKKDRKYAQELMKLIHENDFARDIAIWYDEFLTPGEDFNNAIKSALEKSDLFALTVTPSLLEMPGGKPNFVMDKEFPAARDSGKPILPAEMIATNRNELNDKYNDIPDPVGEGDKKALSERLLALLKKIAIAENDKDPQHNYFIGLAYLSGIDVEVDYNKAEELISGAAEQNFIPAVKKLVNMYSTGKGVIRDYHKAVEWQERFVELCKAEYDSQPSVDNAVMLLSELSICGNAYYDLRDMERSKEMFLQMKQYAERFCEMYDDYVFPRLLSLSFDRLGDIDWKEAGSHYEAYYRSSFELREKVARETGEIYDRSALATSYDKLGNVQLGYQNGHKAYEYYQKSFDLREAILAESSSIQAHRDVAVSYDHLGDALFSLKGEIKTGTKVKELYKKALEIREELAKETHEAIDMRNLTASYRNVGKIIMMYDAKYRETEEFYLQGVEICNGIASEYGTVEAWRDVFISYRELAESAQLLHITKKQEEYLLKAADIAERLERETGTVESLRDLIYCYQLIGDCYYIQLRDLDKAEIYYLKRAETQEKLKALNPMAVSNYDKSYYVALLAEIAEKKEDFEKAEQYYLEAQKSAEEEEPGSVRYCKKLGDIAKQKKEWSKAEEYYLKLAKHHESDVKNTDQTVSRYKELTRDYQILAELAKQIGNREKDYTRKAQDYSRKAQESDKERMQSDDPKTRFDYYCSSAHSAKNKGDLKSAEENYLSAIQLSKQILKEDTTKYYYINGMVSGVYESLGDILTKREDSEEAIQQFNNAIRALENRITNGVPNFVDRRQIVRCYMKLAKMAEQSGNTDAAEVYHLKAVELCEQCDKRMGTIYDKRDLVAQYDQIYAFMNRSGNNVEARKWLEKQIETAEALAKETNEDLDQLALATIYEHFGMVEQKNGNQKAAEAYYLKNVRLREQLVRRNDNPKRQDELGVAYYELGELLNDAEMLRAARGIFSELFLSDRNNQHYHTWFLKTMQAYTKAKGGLMSKLFGRRDRKRDKR